jgi:membrane-associated protease RseP (regulator of RpoE activity)
MRKVISLMFGLALLGSADATAQETRTVTVRPGYIGIRFHEENFLSSAQSSSNRAQVVVKDVSKDSPAAKAGIRTGDQILRINGLSVANGKFGAVARTLTEGDTVRLRIKRADKEREYTVIAAARPADYHTMIGDRTVIFSTDSVRGLMRMYMDSARVHLDSMKLPRIWAEAGDSSFNIRIERLHGMPGDTLIFNRGDTAAIRRFRGRLLPDDVLRHRYEGDFGPGGIFRSIELGTRSIAGAEFADLDPAMKTYFGTDRGLLTLRVVPETPAARAGLQPGDVIVKAGNRAVSTVPELRRLLMSEPATLKLEVLRKGETRTLEIRTQRKVGNE